MSGFFNMIQTLFICLTIFGLAFTVLLAMPKSKLRSYCLEIGKYLLALALALLVISPIDILPDVIPVLGFGDDLAYIVGAFAAIASARKERAERKYLP